MKQSFARNVSSLEELFGFIERFAEAQTLGEGVRFVVRLAVEELFTNLVRHNTGGGAAIDVSLDRDGGELIIRLADFDVDPVSVDPDRPVDVDLPLAERTPGGLGIHLVKSMVDSLTYEYEHRTFRVTAIKHLEDTHV
jgi:anti-sigma regulatory factor (Ser/Thr protein kinase)